MLRKSPPERSAILDIDEMGPVAAKSYPGQHLIDGKMRPAERAKQELELEPHRMIGADSLPVVEVVLNPDLREFSRVHREVR